MVDYWGWCVCCYLSYVKVAMDKQKGVARSAFQCRELGIPQFCSIYSIVMMISSSISDHSPSIVLASCMAE
jgi:hypothetical protein